MFKPTVDVFVSTMLSTGLLRLTDEPNGTRPLDGASLYRPKIEKRWPKWWSMRTLPASRLAAFEALPVNCPVQLAADTGPFGFGYAFRKGAIAADAEQVVPLRKG